jgi:heme/copper-type cytochrome/quinol oxidase subunit 3
VLALPAAPAQLRPRMLLVAASIAIAAVAMLVAGQLGTYLNLREASGGHTTTWLPKGTVMNEVAANLMLITMAGMSLVVQWAVYAMHRGDRRNASYALVLTVVFGILVLNAQGFIWVQLKVPFAASPFATLMYTITGTFFAALAGGLVMVGVTAFRAFGGRYSTKDTEGISASAIVVHGLTVIYAAVWFFIYVLK